MKYLNNRKKKAIVGLSLATLLSTGTVAPILSTQVATAATWGLYSVRQEGKTLGAYESREVAIREAKKWADSQVIQDGSVIWAFTDTLYKVYQEGKILGAYQSKDVAIRIAKNWANSEVRQNGSVVWAFTDTLYKVYQEGKILGVYQSKDVAIRVAKNWAGSEVRQNGVSVWSFGKEIKDGLYRVYQGGLNLGVYESKNVAIREAGKWAGSEVIQNGGVVWKFGDRVSAPVNTNSGSVTAPGKGRIKGNHSSSGEKIYHVPGGQFYDETFAEEYFETEAQARAAGYRRSLR